MKVETTGGADVFDTLSKLEVIDISGGTVGSEARLARLTRE